MNFSVKTSLGILLLIALIDAQIDQFSAKFNEQCQVNKDIIRRFYFFK